MENKKRIWGTTQMDEAYDEMIRMEKEKQNGSVFKNDEKNDKKEMEASMKFLSDKNFIERISLRDGMKRKFKLVKDEATEIIGFDGNKKQGITYTVTENGNLRSFFTTSLKCISMLSKLQKDDVFEIELRTKKVGDTLISYHVVKKL